MISIFIDFFFMLVSLIFCSRHTFNDDGLPDWFLEDERKHRKYQLPVSRVNIQYFNWKMHLYFLSFTIVLFIPM